MSTQYTIKKGVERKIIEDFITSNNAINWIANISKTINKDRSGVEKIVKSLANKGILKRIVCPDGLLKKMRGEREKGGAFPSDCYLLNYDMNPEWFVEIARPHLDNDDKKIRLKFMKSGMTYRMIRYETFIDWIVKNKIGFNLKKEKDMLPFIFNSFPSTLRWVLYDDLSIIHNMKEKPELQMRFFLSLLNNKIIEDLLDKSYLRHEDLAQMGYGFTTRFSFYGLKTPKDKKGEMILGHGEITGGFEVTFKEIPEITFYNKDTGKKSKSRK